MLGRKNKDKELIYNTSRNVVLGTAGLIIVSVFGLLERRVFSDHLSNDFLGLNSLFSGILNVLSLAEMGFGSALAYFLYAPLAKHDESRIRILVKYLKRAYRVVGTFVLGAGLLVVPFLGIIAKTDIPLSQVRLFYVIYLLGIVGGYYFSYSAVVLEADQNLYLQSMIESGFRIIQYSIQMAVLALTESYLLYITVYAVSNAVNYLLIHIFVTCKYRYITIKVKGEKLDRETKQTLIKDIKGLLITKTGHILSNNVDTFLLSMLAGLSVLGNYSYYSLIFIGIGSVTNLMFSSFNASIGHYCALESKRNSYIWFRRFTNYYTLIMGLIFTVTGIIINPLLKIMYPNSELFSPFTVLLLVFSRYASTMRHITRSFEQSYGIFYQDRYKTMIDFVFNLISSLLLFWFIGYDGIFLGSIISYFLSYFWIEPATLFRHPFRGFRKAGYWISMIKGFLIFCCAFTMGTIVSGYIYRESIFSFILLTVLSIAIFVLFSLIFMPKVCINLVKTKRRANQC